MDSMQPFFVYYKISNMKHKYLNPGDSFLYQPFVYFKFNFFCLIQSKLFFCSPEQPHFLDIAARLFLRSFILSRFLGIPTNQLTIRN